MKRGKNTATEFIKIRGIVSSGAGESKLFTEIPWARKQFREKLGFNPHPGTFNIIVLPEDRDKLKSIKNMKGITILPEDVNFCAGKSFIARINDRVKGGVIIPLIPSYPEGQLEVISAEHIKNSLSLRDGDLVEIDIYP
jgi:riboflavin kinase